MKKLVLLFIVIIALTFQACDKIDGPYTTPIAGQSWNGKKVLLEDYTGHTCVNCPRAGHTASNLEALYGNELVVIAVHCGVFALPDAADGLPQDFRTIAGTAWDNFFSISANGLPNGMINRLGYPSTNIIGDAAWASTISNIIAQYPKMSVIFQDTVYNAADSTVTGTVDVKFLNANQYKLNVQICITEDSIIAPQKNDTIYGDPSLHTDFDLTYVFMHMLRGAVNGSWGQQITDGTTYNLVGTDVPTPFSYVIPKSLWMVKNCHIVAFVYDANTYEVYQVEQIPIP